MRRLFLFLFCALLFAPTPAQVTRPWVGKNSKLVTVCSASACDYQTIQAALDGTTGTATAPVTILVMPGRYSECLNVAHDDDYKTIQSFAPRQAELYCNATPDTTPAIDVNLTSATTDLDQFGIVGMRITLGEYTDEYGIKIVPPQGASSQNPTFVRFDLLLQDSEIDGGYVASIFAEGSQHDDPSGEPSYLYLANNTLKPYGNAVQFWNSVSIRSINTTVRAFGLLGGNEAKCWSDHGSAGTFRGTSVLVTGDDCEIEGLTNSTLDPTCGVCLYTGAHRNMFSGGSYFLRAPSSVDTYGPMCFFLGVTSAGTAYGLGRLNVYDSQCFIDAQNGSAATYGVVANEGARIRLKGVTFYSFGLSSMTHAWSRSGAMRSSFIKYTGTNVVSTLVEGSGTITEAP